MAAPQTLLRSKVLALSTSRGYTFGMKTAISLPDEVFEEAERLASRLKVSRSELYAKALQDFVRRHAPDAITDAYDQICSEIQPDPEPFVQRAARRSLGSVDW